MKSEGLIGLEMEVIWIPRLFEAALILGSASLPFIGYQHIKNSFFINKLRNSIIKWWKLLFFLKNDTFFLYGGVYRYTHLVIIDCASRIDSELGIETPFLDQVCEYPFSSWAPADVAQTHEEHVEWLRLRVCASGWGHRRSNWRKETVFAGNCRRCWVSQS